MFRIPVWIIFFLFPLLFTAVFSSAAEERFSGTGIQAVPVSSGELVVLAVVDGAPADRSGLRPGDLIVQVDDLPLRGSDFEQVVRNYLWGEAGTALTIVYLRPGREGRISVKIVRERVTGDVEMIPGIRLMQPKPHN